MELKLGYFVTTTILNKRSVALAMQLLYFKSYPRFNFLDLDNFCFFCPFRALQPKLAPPPPFDTREDVH